MCRTTAREKTVTLLGTATGKKKGKELLNNPNRTQTLPYGKREV